MFLLHDDVSGRIVPEISQTFATKRHASSRLQEASMLTAGRSLTAVAIAFGLALSGCATGPGAGTAVSAPAPTVPYHPPTQLGGGPDDLPKRGTHFGDLFAPDPARKQGLDNVRLASGGADAARMIFDEYVRAAHKKFPVIVQPATSDGLNTYICSVMLDPKGAGNVRPLSIHYNVHRASGFSWINYIRERGPKANDKESIRLIFLNRPGFPSAPNYGGQTPKPPTYGTTPGKGTICDMEVKEKEYTAGQPLPGTPGAWVTPGPEGPIRPMDGGGGEM